MSNKMFVKKISVGLIACAASLFSTLSQGVPIASFDTQVNVNVSSTFVSSEFESFLCCNDVYVEGNALGSASGTGDGGPDTLAAGDIGVLNAAANGEATGVGSYVDSVWSTSGYLVIDNKFGLSAITGDVTFEIFLSANIFTDELYSDAYAGAYIYIENYAADIIFDYFIEFESFYEGAGTFGENKSQTIVVTGLTIDAGDFEEYYIEIDAVGFAEVSEPGGILLVGLALVFAVRKRKMSANPICSRASSLL
jgi:hypothetical protein